MLFSAVVLKHRPTNSHLKPFLPDGDVTEADRKKAQAERQRQAALRSSVIQELRQQYSDAPEEIREKRDFQSERESRDELHRCSLVCFVSAGRHTKADECAIKWERLWGLCLITSIYQNILYGQSFTFISLHHQFFLFSICRKNYEESMMVRLNMPKHQKNSKKRSVMSMSSHLSGITHFSDITALTGGEGGQVGLVTSLTCRDGVVFHSLSSMLC